MTRFIATGIITAVLVSVAWAVGGMLYLISLFSIGAALFAAATGLVWCWVWYQTKDL